MRKKVTTGIIGSVPELLEIKMLNERDLVAREQNRLMTQYDAAENNEVVKRKRIIEEARREREAANQRQSFSLNIFGMPLGCAQFLGN